MGPLSGCRRHHRNPFLNQLIFIFLHLKLSIHTILILGFSFFYPPSLYLRRNTVLIFAFNVRLMVYFGLLEEYVAEFIIFKEDLVVLNQYYLFLPVIEHLFNNLIANVLLQVF